MKTTNLNDLEQSFLNAVQKEHLTSYEILQRVEDVSMLLSLYNILDKLSNKGILKSYVKQDTKYHYVA
jgi:DNA-binding PadR family transcriptional regulator